MKYQIQLMLIEKLATKLLRKRLNQRLSYHNFKHTQDVVKAAGEIGRQSQLSSDEIQLVQIAAWLHDLGHLKTYADHETESKNIALELLDIAGMPEKETAIILGCIEATRMPQQPQNRLEKVLCDADLAHLARQEYAERNEMLRREWEIIFGKVYSDQAWGEENSRFLAKHCYFTTYGKTVLAQGKERNLHMVCSLTQTVAA